VRLEYNIQTTGLGQLKRVLRSVEQEQTASNRRAVNASTRLWATHLARIRREMATLQGRGVGRGGSTAAAKGNLVTEQRARLRGVAAEQASRIAAAKAEADAQKAHQRTVRQFARKGNQRKLREIAREERAAVTAAKTEAREQARNENYRHRLRLRNIEREKAREISAMARARAAEQRRGAARMAGVGTGITRSVGGAALGVGRTVAGLGALGGGFAAFGAVRNQMQVGAAASALANKALGTPGETRTREQIRGDVIKQSRTLGASSGLGATGIIAALDKFTAISGRLGMGQKLAPFMADIADATGADIGDVGRTAGQITQAMMARGMEEPEALKETKEIMTSMMAQAKVGSIEFADLATNMGKVMSSTAAFDGNVSELATTMGAVAQLAIAGAASSPEEAMTAILRFRDDMIKNAGRFQKQGVDVFADKEKTRLKSPEQIMFDMLEKTGGSLPKVGKLFGIRAQKAVTPFQALYTAKGGGEAGLQAVKDLLENAKAAIPMSEVATSAAFRRRDEDKQLAMVVEKFNAAVGSELLPVLTRLIPKFADLVPKIADATKAVAGMASWAVENPLKGIGAIILAKVTADIAAAQLGSAVSKGVGSLLQRAPMGSLAIASAAFAVTTGTIAIETLVEGKEKGQRQAAVNEARRGAAIANATVALQRSQRAGGVMSLVPEKSALLTTAESTVERTKRVNEVATQGFFETLWNSVTGGAGFEAVAQAQEEQKSSQAAINDTAEMLALLSTLNDSQQEAISEQKANTAAQRETAEAVRKLAPPSGSGADSPRRNSPILNRGQ